MLWFEMAEVVIQLSPLELYEENLAELRTLNHQFAAAEEAIMEHCRIRKDPRVHFLFARGRWRLHARWNAMYLDPVLQKLESNRAEILRKRAATLSEHVRLKKECGLGNF